MNRANDRPGDESRAVSPVVGTALLLVVLVLLVATTGVMLVGFTGELKAPMPLASTKSSVPISVVGNATSQRLEIVHRGGDTVAARDLRIQLTSGGSRTVYSIPRTGDLADGKWSAGETLSLPLNRTGVCSGGAKTATVSVVTRAHGQSAVLSSKRVPITRQQFVIRDGRVRPTTAYTANVTVLGAAMTWGLHGPPVPIELKVRVGNATHQPASWHDVNDGNNPRQFTVADQRAGTNISVWARAYLSNGHTVHAYWSTDTASGLVKVLRDGDHAPIGDGFGNQQSAAAFVADYVDANGTVTLADNQAIFLYELGASDPNDASADFQDVVVLVSLESSASTSVTNAIDGRSTIVCVPSTGGS